MSQPVTLTDALVSEPVTLINAFTVPPDESERFLHWWKDNARIMAGQPGFIRARMYRCLDDDAELRFINVAEWHNRTDRTDRTVLGTTTPQPPHIAPDVHRTAGRCGPRHPGVAHTIPVIGHGTAGAGGAAAGAATLRKER